MSRSRLSRCATEANTSAAISVSASRRKSIAAYAASSEKPAQPSIATRSATQPVAASLLPGSSARCATSAKTTRSTCSVQPAAVGGAPDGRAHAQALPEPVHRPPPAQPAGVEDLHLGPGGRRDRLLRLEEAGDRGHQPAQRLAVDLVRPAEVVDHLRHRAAGHRMPLVVRQGQVADHRTVPVGPPRLPQVHALQHSTELQPRPAGSFQSCAYTISAPDGTGTALTCTNTNDQARICLPTSELRTGAPTGSAPNWSTPSCAAGSTTPTW